MDWKLVTLKSFALVGMLIVAVHIVKVAIKPAHCDITARAEGRCAPAHFDRAL